MFDLPLTHHCGTALLAAFHAFEPQATITELSLGITGIETANGMFQCSNAPTPFLLPADAAQEWATTLPVKR
jgi:hypothetical protein